MDLLNIFLIVTGVCAFIYTIQLVYLDKIRLQSGTVAEATSRKRARLLRAGPVVCSILAAIALVLVPLLGNSRSEACLQENNEINPDVGGIGVLLGLFLPCLVLLVVLILGHFTAHTSGAKELCMAQCANLLYLTINLAKGTKGLNAQELGIAISSIDAVSASISMAFSDKDVLAARKLVGFGFVTQLAAFSVQAAAFDTYSKRGTFRCKSSTTNQSFPHYYSTPYWVYLFFRVAASILPCEMAFRLTSGLNKIEHKYKASQSPRVKSTALWRSLPATLATTYLIYGSFALLHGLSIYNILRGTNTIKQSWLSLWTEWGQSANAIIAIFAVVHVAYAIYRIFVAESTNDDGPISGVSGRSFSHAYPQQGWLKWPRRACAWIKQSWPFSRGLDYSNHLLVDESMLQEILDPPLQQTPEVRKRLHKELMYGFTFNEPDTIFDCLDRGAPVNEPNDDGDYPIHLAAHNNNTDILMRTRFRFTKDSVTHDSLLLRNSASKTPLAIACSTGTLKAVRWIMERLPQTNIGTQDAVRQAFELAILEEKLGVLEVLKELWHDWRTLELQSSGRFYPLDFAIENRKAEPAYRLINPEIINRRQQSARRIFELCWKSKLDTYWTRIMLEDIQIEPSDSKRLLDAIMDSSTVENAEALELLLALNVNVYSILRNSINRQLQPELAYNGRDSMWKLVLQGGYAFELQDLDNIIVYELQSRHEDTNLIRREDIELQPPLPGRAYKLEPQADLMRLLKDRVREALIHHGGRDWSEVVIASIAASTKRLKELIGSEKDQTMLQRMLNVEAGPGISLLSYTIWSQGDDERGSRRLEYMRILLQHGSCVKADDLVYAHTYTSFKSIESILAFMLLAVYANPGTASSAMLTMCTRIKPSANMHTFVQVLLRCGANPTLMTYTGSTLQQYLSGMSDKASKQQDLSRRDVLRKRGLDITVSHEIFKTAALLQRWEDYQKDPHSGKPTERPDEDWNALRRKLDDTTTWAWLDQKNPDGFKIVEEH